MARRRRGKWSPSQLSAVTISLLMGVSPHTARRYLYRLRGSRNPKDIPEEEIGTLIQDYLNNKELIKISKSLKNLDKEIGSQFLL